jgi:hypothetical protein
MTDREKAEAYFIQMYPHPVSIEDEPGRAAIILAYEAGLTAATEQRDKELIAFAEWIHKRHYWKSTDNRYPVTLGRWTTGINGNVPYDETYTTTDLLTQFRTSSQAKEAGEG